MKEIYLYNQYHLGDCIFQIHYCNMLIMKNPFFNIIFYCNPNYHKELEEWIEYKDKITLEDINKGKLGFNTWVNTFGDYDNRLKYNNYYDKIYISFYEKLSKQIEIENPIKNSIEFLFNEDIILNKKNKLSDEHFDYLIINSQGNSGQWNYVEEDFNNLYKKLLEKGMKIVTTAKTPFEEIKCTLNYNLSLLDIGKISTNSKNVMGIHTGPHAPTMNIWNMNTPNIIFQNQGTSYSYKNCYNIKNSVEIKKIKI